MSNSHPRRALGALAALVLGAGLAACGGGGKDAAKTGGSSALSGTSTSSGTLTSAPPTTSAGSSTSAGAGQLPSEGATSGGAASSGGSSAGSTGVAGKTPAAQFCTAAPGAMSGPSQGDQLDGADDMAGRYAAHRDALARVEPPAEIASAWEHMRNAYDEQAKAYAAEPKDTSDVEAWSAWLDSVPELDDAAFTAASEQVMAYFSTHCAAGSAASR